MARKGSESPGETLSGIKDVVVAYAKQETVDPLRGVGRYLKFGLPGAVLVGMGLLLLALSGLRALQTEGPSWVTGNLSWLPYLFTLIGLGIAIGILALMIRRGRPQ